MMHATTLPVLAALLLSGCSLFHKFAFGSRVACESRHEWFANNVEPLLETRCATCHVEKGIASSSGFLLSLGTGAADANYASLNYVSQQTQDGTSLLLLKPTGVVQHTGGKLAPPGSAEFDALSTMVTLFDQCTDEMDAALAQAAGEKADPNAAPSAPTYLPATVRRLSLTEIDNSVADVLGVATKPSATLAPDVRQSGFTANLAQRVDANLGDQLQATAEALAAEAVATRLVSLLPCAPASTGCDAAFVDKLASRAFRRPVTAEERADLLQVFHVAADGNLGSFNDGVKAVISAVLQSASFLYVPQVGTGAGQAKLDAYETAAVLAYLLTASPPDQALLDAAAQGALQTADQREAQARRLLASSAGNTQIVRFVREWLGIDTLAGLPRTSSVDFEALKPKLAAETADFVTYALAKDGATIATLIGADVTVADAALASFYGVAGPSPQSLAATPRRGLLSQGAFLARFAHETYSSPVKRGVAVLRKLMCIELAAPSGEVGMKAMQPLPADPSATTRTRFTQHASDPSCSGCHAVIDGLGFAFEEFDQVGQLRTVENGQAIDASGVIAGTDVDGPYTDAASMLSKLAASDKVARCLATYLVRFGSTATSAGVEETFVAEWAQLPAEKRTSLSETLVAYVRSDLFNTRSMQ